LHRAVVASKDNLVKSTIASFEQKWGKIHPGTPDLQMVALLGVLDHIDRIREWPVDYELVLGEVVVSMIPLVATYIARL
jgi:hypothetical protein